MHLLFLFLGISIIGANSLLISPIMNDISNSLNTSATYIALSASSYGAGTAFSAYFLAKLGDKYGQRIVLIFSGVILSLGISLSGFANHWLTLVTAQAFAGLAAGSMIPSLYSMASNIAPAGQSTKYVSKVLTGWAMAMVFGVPFSALVADLYSWRSSYFILGAVTAIITVCFWFLPRQQKNSNRAKLLSKKQLIQLPLLKPMLWITAGYMMAFYGIYIFIGDYSVQTLDVTTTQSGFIAMYYGFGFALAMVADSWIDKKTPYVALPIVLAAATLIYLSMIITKNSFITLLISCAIWGFINHILLNCLVLILGNINQENKVAIIGFYSCTTYIATMIAGILFGFVYTKLGGFSASLLLAALSLACILIIAKLKISRASAPQ